MRIGITKVVETEIKSIFIHTKTRDSISGELRDDNNQRIIDFDSQYTPSFFPEDHYGDYLILNIDLETGMILNWKKPSEEKLREFYKLISEEE